MIFLNYYFCKTANAIQDWRILEEFHIEKDLYVLSHKTHEKSYKISFFFKDFIKKTLEVDYLFLNSNWERSSLTLINSCKQTQKHKNLDQRAVSKLSMVRNYKTKNEPERVMSRDFLSVAKVFLKQYKCKR